MLGIFRFLSFNDYNSQTETICKQQDTSYVIAHQYLLIIYRTDEGDYEYSSCVCNRVENGIMLPGCVTKCDRGRGSKVAKKSVTYFMDGPFPISHPQPQGTRTTSLVNPL